MAGEKILIIDDRPENIELLADYILRPHGYIPLAATNGHEGLRMALSEKPDLIILDLRMPGMTGLEVLEALRAERCNISAILITAYGSEDVVIRALRLGVRDYIVRPFEVDEVLAAVDRTLRESRLEREREELLYELEQRVKELSALYWRMRRESGAGRAASEER